MSHLRSSNHAMALPQRIPALQPRHCAKPSTHDGNRDPQVSKTPPQSLSAAGSQTAAQPSLAPRMSTTPAQRDDLNSQSLTGNLANQTAVELSSCPLNIQAGMILSQADTRAHPGPLLHEVNPLQAGEQGNPICKHLSWTEIWTLLGKFYHLIYLRASFL